MAPHEPHDISHDDGKDDPCLRSVFPDTHHTSFTGISDAVKAARYYSSVY